jgi:phosphoglycolate phosphatase
VTPQPLTALLFDKDGTLIDFDRTWGPAAHAVMTVMAGGDRARLERLMTVSAFIEAEMRFLPTSPLVAGSSGDYGRLWAEALGEPFSSAFTDRMDALFVEAGARTLSPIGDVRGLFDTLAARNLALGIVTNDSESGARSQAGHLGITHHLDFVAGWDSGHGRKPAPGQIEAYLRHSRRTAGEVAMIGDSTHDLHAARAAGVLAIGVRTGPHQPDDFVGLCDVLLDDIHALPAWLDSRIHSPR